MLFSLCVTYHGGIVCCNRFLHCCGIHGLGFLTESQDVLATPRALPIISGLLTLGCALNPKPQILDPPPGPQPEFEIEPGAYHIEDFQQHF